jgi:lipoprotein signal peptidase
MKPTTKITSMTLAAVGILALDEGIKTIVRTSLSPCVRPPLWACDQVHLIGRGVTVLRAENAGSALGAAQGLWVWTLLAAMGLGVAVSLRRHSDDRPWLRVSIGLMAGGAVANLLDRVIFGRVTDFLSFVWNANRGLAVNVADLALLVGTIATTVQLYRVMFNRSSKAEPVLL